MRFKLSPLGEQILSMILLRGLLKTEFSAFFEVTKRMEPDFQLIRKRWIAERTFGWFNHYRRLSKNYEILARSSEAMIEIINDSSSIAVFGVKAGF